MAEERKKSRRPLKITGGNETSPNDPQKRAFEQKKIHQINGADYKAPRKGGMTLGKGLNRRKKAILKFNKGK